MKTNTLFLSAAAYFAKVLMLLSVFFAIHKSHIKFKSPTDNIDRAELNDANGFIEYMFNLRKSSVTGKMDYDAMLQAQATVEQNAAAAYKTGSIGLSWAELGPDNVGGRTRAILIDKNNPSRMYAGGVSGGLWISDNAGGLWTKWSGSDQLQNMAISCFTQAANGDIYFGTGESYANLTGAGANSSSTGFIGGGIWKSTDGGTTFTLLTATKPSANSTGQAWTFVNRMAADPVNASRIYAATGGGLKMTDNGGTTWTTVQNGSADVVLTGSDGSVVAAVNNSCYISPTGNSGSFVNKSGSSGGKLPAASGRLELAIAPSDPNYIYASLANGAGKLQGIYRSTDGGTVWTVIGAGGASLFDIFTVGPSSQGLYNNALAVFPEDKNDVLVAGQDLWEWKENASTPGVGQWGLVSRYFPQYSGDFLWVHADKHIIVFNPVAGSNTFFVGCDGGIFRGYHFPGGININGNNYSYVYSAMNKGYNVTECYSVAFEANGSYGTGVMGGAQDNGTNYISGGNGTSGNIKNAYEVGSGDGMECEISFINPNAFFITVYSGDLDRSSNKGNGSSGFYSQNLESPTAGNNSIPKFNASFITPIALYETYNATNSPDSITFTANPLNQSIAGQNGSKINFTGTLTGDQPEASIIPGTIKITSGNQVITDDGNGIFVGSVSGSSNIIDYTTKAFNFNFTTAPKSSESIVATFNVKYNPGASIDVRSKTNNTLFKYITPTLLTSGSSVTIQDIIQSKLVTGFSSPGGVWMTKHPLDFTKTPDWYQIANSIANTVETFAWSKDGDILYVGTDGGNLYRISGLAAVRDSATGDAASSQKVTTQTEIANFGRIITNIAVDPNNADRMLITLGRYGNSTNIYYCSNATTAPASTSSSNFTSKQGSGSTGIPAMPLYCAIFENNDPNIVLVGTEYGVYATTDITVGNPIWTDENASFTRAPVFALRQQTLPPWNCNNSGMIYAGTFGRGIWKCNTYYVPTGIADKSNAKNSFMPDLMVYPNPLNGEGKISFHLNKPDNVVISIYDMQGRAVKSTKMELIAGEQKIDISSNDLSAGTYLVTINTKEIHSSARFVVVK